MKHLLNCAFALSIIICCLSCKDTQKATVDTAAFYEMSPKYLRADVSGKDYFQVYAKGSNEKDCKKNGAIKVLQALILNGINSGKTIIAILNEPAMINDFKQQEAQFYERAINNSNLLTIESLITDSKKLKQSYDKNTTYSMQVVVAVNRTLLSKEVLSLITKN